MQGAFPREGRVQPVRGGQQGELAGGGHGSCSSSKRTRLMGTNGAKQGKLCGMDFPIIDLLDEELSIEWLMKYFHPAGLRCPHCQAAWSEARYFRANVGSGLPVYRCHACQGIYHLYSGTLFEGSQLTPPQVVLLLRGFLQGQSSAQLARELNLAYKTVLKWRHRVQANAERLQPDTPLIDTASESDEMCQNAGGKRGQTPRPSGPAAPSGEQTTRTRHVCQ